MRWLCQLDSRPPGLQAQLTPAGCFQGGAPAQAHLLLLLLQLQPGLHQDLLSCLVHPATGHLRWQVLLCQCLICIKGKL